MSPLVAKQHAFSQLVGRFLLDLATEGYVVSLGEAWRPKDVALLYEKENRGTANSLHIDRLAIDLVLRKHGMLLQETEDYRHAGELWESYSTPEHECVWGGRFKKRPDGNHFSVAWGGRR